MKRAQNTAVTTRTDLWVQIVALPSISRRRRRRCLSRETAALPPPPSPAGLIRVSRLDCNFYAFWRDFAAHARASPPACDSRVKPREIVFASPMAVLVLRLDWHRGSLSATVFNAAVSRFLVRWPNERNWLRAKSLLVATNWGWILPKGLIVVVVYELHGFSFCYFSDLVWSENVNNNKSGEGVNRVVFSDYFEWCWLVFDTIQSRRDDLRSNNIEQGVGGKVVKLRRNVISWVNFTAITAFRNSNWWTVIAQLICFPFVVVWLIVIFAFF